MTTLKDFLVWYNNKDVGPFIKALDIQTKFFKTELQLDMLKDGKSIPGLTLRYLFQELSPDVYFSLFNERQADLHTLLREQIVGGPSIIFNRYHEKDQTMIRDGDRKVQKLLGFDANALYLWAMMQAHPTEHPIRRRKRDNEDIFDPEFVDKYGRLAREWLEWSAFIEGVTIQHKFNGSEHSIGERKIRVDGFDGRVVYQFHGCAFHGHKCHLTEHLTYHPYDNTKTQIELYENTTEITDYLREHVPVVEMWECQWLELKRSNPCISAFLADNKITFRSSLYGKVTTKLILSKVHAGDFFGLIQCDVEVPELLKPHFSEMPPIFKNAYVSKGDIGEHMKQYCDDYRLLSQPRRTLIGSFFGKGILLTSPLLKWYLEHGLIVTDIQQVIEYRPQRCFEKFGKTVSDARRQGDENPDSSILSDTFKLLGNSSYGKTVEDLGRHHTVKYVNDSSRLVNNPRFLKQTALDDDLMEVEMGKPRVKWSLPFQIGFFVYNYAKLRMLQFYYDCLLPCIDPADFELCEMDTDSLYLVISAPSLDHVIREDCRKLFYQTYHNWFPSPACEIHRLAFVETKCAGETWTPQVPCCTQQLDHDKREPGLFKVEYEGDGIVALTSKTYFCFGDYNKSAAKGLSKHLNSLSKEQFLHVLHTKSNGGGINRGFRIVGNSVLTYEQYRSSLSYLYIKRKVSADGRTTSPLDI